MQADQSWLFRFGDCFFSLKEIRFFVVDLVLDEYFFLRAEKTNDKKWMMGRRKKTTKEEEKSTLPAKSIFSHFFCLWV